ncbi:MAG: hypothetical protein HC802_11645 [Caldilineaceae bacterium]|nr:hypothetical protein [Caldilineaceae bacterium]
MSDKSVRCIANTQSGTRCRLKAVEGSEYCHIHGSKTPPATQTAAAAPTIRVSNTVVDPKTTPPVAATQQPAKVEIVNEITPVRRRSSVQLELLVAELNELAAELRRLRPDFRPPPFSPARMQALLKETVDKYTPDAQIELLRDLQNNLKDVTAKDMVDPETWKGLWYILNYSVQYQAAALKEALLARLANLPGMALAGDIRQNLAGTSPKEFLDIDTWKGLWYVLSYTAQMQAQAGMRRLMGGSDEDAEADDPATGMIAASIAQWRAR